MKWGDSMTQEERMEFLIQELMSEEEELEQEMPETYEEKRKLLRALMNIRMPKKIPHEFLKVQNAFLTEEAKERGIVYVENLPVASSRRPDTKIRNASKIVLWQGDITRLSVDAIVNAANGRLLGCFIPNHGCIDNAIHSAAGLQLREECAVIMEDRTVEEAVGGAQLTGAYNLPCEYVIHTVGPTVSGELTRQNLMDLRNCYHSCLELAEINKLTSIAFGCIATEAGGFPKEEAAAIAVDTIDKFLDKSLYVEKVVINVFQEEDYKIYDRLFQR